MELSLLCDSNIILIVTTEDNVSSSFYSSNGGNIVSIKKYINNLLSKNIRHNYTNEDVILHLR